MFTSQNAVFILGDPVLNVLNCTIADLKLGSSSIALAEDLD
ncbi:hypothetical protein ACQ4M3_06565 [Leptolyngbya sp. AN03gr2]